MARAIEAIRLEPDSWYGYVNAGYRYTALGRFDEAKAAINTGLQKTNGAVVMPPYGFRSMVSSLRRVEGFRLNERHCGTKQNRCEND
jgi:hypothetical protein